MMICKFGENTQGKSQNNMQNCEKNEELVAEIERQQREYRGQLKMLEPGSAEWKLMQVRIDGNEIIKKTLMGTKTKRKIKQQ